MIGRRKFLIGAAALLCTPAIVRAESLMPVSSAALSAAPKVITPDWAEWKVVARYIVRLEPYETWEEMPADALMRPALGPLVWTTPTPACSRRAL
jgi:hypothetical protein